MVVVAHLISALVFAWICRQAKKAHEAYTVGPPGPDLDRIRPFCITHSNPKAVTMAPKANHSKAITRNHLFFCVNTLQF